MCSPLALLCLADDPWSYTTLWSNGSIDVARRWRRGWRSLSIILPSSTSPVAWSPCLLPGYSDRL